MFGVNNAELPTGKKYIQPGILQVDIVGLSFEGDYFSLKLKPSGEEDNTANDFRFYINGDANVVSKTMNKFYEIVEAVDPTLTEVAAQTPEQYINLLAPKMVGKSYVQKFRGQQSEPGGKFWARIPGSRRSKANRDFSIAAPVGQEDILEFDKNNEWDMMAAQGDVNMTTAEQAGDEAPSWS